MTYNMFGEMYNFTQLGMNKLSTVTVHWCLAGNRTHSLLITSPMLYRLSK